MKGKKDPFDDYTAPVRKSAVSSEKDDCSDITFPTMIENHTEDLAGSIVGNLLEIRLEIGNVLGVFNDLGERCGYIASIYNGRMIACIGRGQTFSARLKDVSGRVIVTCN